MTEPTPPPPGPADPAPGTAETTGTTGTDGPGPTRQSSAHDPLRGSRTSGVWAGVVLAAVLLVLLVVFIVQNTQSVRISYFGWNGEAPLSAALLIATVAGMAIAILAASLRILQLRRRVRRERH